MDCATSSTSGRETPGITRIVRWISVPIHRGVSRVIVPRARAVVRGPDRRRDG
jgi:hypothetical protein